MKRVISLYSVIKLYLIILIIFIFSMGVFFFAGGADGALSSEKAVVQKPHEYLTMIAKSKHGEFKECLDNSCKKWKVRLIRIVEKSEQTVRTIKYTLTYGEVTEEKAKEFNYPSLNYILIERFEIVSRGEVILLAVAAYVDFGPDSNIDRAYATGPRGLMKLNPRQANEYFWEFKYPELRKFIKNKWFDSAK